MSALRLLGFAFAAADLLVELDDRWRVTFAAGAAPAPDRAGPDSMVALRLDEVLTRASVERLSIELQALTPGRRIGPVEVEVRAGEGYVRRGRLRAIMLPELAPCISCAIAYSGAVEAAKDESGLAGPDAFNERTAAVLGRLQGTGAPVSLALVELQGVDRASPKAAAAVREIEAMLKAASLDGQSASRVAEQRYALLRNPEQPLDLADRLRDLGRRRDLPLTARVSEAPIAPAANPMATLRAVRHTLNAFLSGETRADGGAGVTFTAALMRTLKEADAFKAQVARRDFALSFQPIVKLASGKVHHYEVLARFSPGESPAAKIRMAEEMALVTEFDLAVADKALRELKAGDAELRLAVNVSGASLARDGFMKALLDLTAGDVGLRPRMFLEITESAAMDDVAAANARIQHLRQAGFKVAIDDFGAGAASFDYLRRLSVDAVKIDGRYVREAVTDFRSQKMIAHLVGLCRSLKLATVAEMIETDEVAALMLKLGVDQGQGWNFGRPAERPQPVRIETPRARRLGSIDSWG